jgi:chromate transporter
MREGSALEVFVTFLKLGVTAFGGAVAHIGYFREEIVIRRRWVEDAVRTDLVALCQFPVSGPLGAGLLHALKLGAGCGRAT